MSSSARSKDWDGCARLSRTDGPMSESEFSGLVAALTGGRSGRGLAIAPELSRRGASTWILDLDASSLDEQFTIIGCDVSSDQSVERAIDVVIYSASKGTVAHPASPRLGEHDQSCSSRRWRNEHSARETRQNA